MAVIAFPAIRIERPNTPLTIVIDEKSRRRLLELCRVWKISPEEAAAHLLAQKLRELNGVKR